MRGAELGGLGDFFQEGGDGVGAELGCVEGGGGKIAKAGGDFFRGDGVKFWGGFADNNVSEF